MKIKEKSFIKIKINFSLNRKCFPLTMFGSVVVVVFSSVFYSEKYANNVFFIFKKLFLRSTHQNDLKT
jgi:hypothetical protein